VPPTWGAMSQTVLEKFGRIDILFNNAGVSCVGALHETLEAEWTGVMAINTKGGHFLNRLQICCAHHAQDKNRVASSTWLQGRQCLDWRNVPPTPASKGAVYSRPAASRLLPLGIA